jgi:hypothetical protein
MKAIKLAPETMHDSQFSEDVFQGALSLEEAMGRLTTDVAQKQFRKDEEQDRTLRLEQFRALLH